MKAIESKLFALVFDDPDTAGEAGAALLRAEGEEGVKTRQKPRHRPGKRRTTALPKSGSRGKQEPGDSII